MTSATTLSLAEYLEVTYRPDREYIDGELKERNVGKWEHARLQYLIANWIGQHEEEWDVIASTEQRMQVSETRIRIPDLVVLRTSCPPDVLQEPPLLVIEVLSPDDSYSELQWRMQDFHHMGVTTMWLIDPASRTAKMCVEGNWLAKTTLVVPGTPIYLDVQDIFRRLDRTRLPSA